MTFYKNDLSNNKPEFETATLDSRTFINQHAKNHESSVFE